MKQSVSHQSVGALILIINVLILKADNNLNKGTYVWSQSLSTHISPFHQTRPQLPESRAAQSQMMLKFAYQKNVLPPPFSFCMCELFLAEFHKASLCLRLLCHISSSECAPPSLIPSCPWRKTKLACLFNEEQSSERGEGALFLHTLKFSGFN